MSKSKELLEWSNEIGLVAGMIFKNKDKQYDFEIIEVQPNEIRVRWLEDNYTSIGFMEIVCFTFDYKLVFDPRSENNFKKESQMNLREQLQKNSEEYIQKEMKESKEYKDFSSALKTELINHSQKSSVKQKVYVIHSRNQPLEREMLKLFCVENNLDLSGFLISWE